MGYDKLLKIAGKAYMDNPMKCSFCGEPVAFGEPGSSIDSEYGNCHTECLYDYRELDMPEILK